MGPESVAVWCLPLYIKSEVERQRLMRSVRSEEVRGVREARVESWERSC